MASTKEQDIFHSLEYQLNNNPDKSVNMKKINC